MIKRRTDDEINAAIKRRNNVFAGILAAVTFVAFL